MKLQIRPLENGAVYEENKENNNAREKGKGQAQHKMEESEAESRPGLKSEWVGGWGPFGLRVLMWDPHSLCLPYTLHFRLCR